MIVEHAEFTVTEGRELEFEQALRTARSVVARAPGFVWIEFARGIERQSVYLVRIAWRSVDDHRKGFRESELYQEWSALVRPFLSADPRVEHLEPRMNQFRG
jgi:heme-degrading monooxygenase HmoA